MSNGAAGASAAAAAAARERMRQEEEEMTGYSLEDLSAGWEFKILRSNTNTFKNPEKLKAVLSEEAKAGWVLLEKFDNSRIRLKRPVSARAGDHALGLDPYRTRVGMSDLALGLIIAGSIFAGIAVISLIVFALATRR
jgi:hypothetical protein